MIKDYMQTNVVTVRPETTLKEALDIMLSKKTNGIVVTDEAGKLVGILSTWDIIEYVVPDYLEEGYLSSFESQDVLSERAKQLQNDPISRFMTKKVHAVKATEYMIEAASLLSEFRIHQLPVLDDNKVVIGYINQTDIKRAIGAALGVHE